MRPIVIVTCCLAFVAACRQGDGLAQTIVWLDAESNARAAISNVAVQIERPNGELEPAVQAQPPDWPVKLVFAPVDNDASRQFTLHIEARDAAKAHLMTLRFESGFVPEQARYATLRIHDACVEPPGPECDDDAQCTTWRVAYSADKLSRDAHNPRKLDVICDASMPDAGADEPFDTMPDAGPGGNTPSGAAGSTSKPQTDGAMPTDAGRNSTGGAGGHDIAQAGTAGADASGCDSGYLRSGGSCEDIDECANATPPCGEHGQCHNTPGSYTCDCDSGYQPADGTCLDIDECQMNNGGCEATCTNSPGSFACDCPEGSWLKADGKSCGSFAAGQRLGLVGSLQPSQPRFAFDGQGNGLAVWTQSDDTSTSLWTRRYRADQGWYGVATKIAIADSGEPSSPRLALDAQGNGAVVWVQTTDSHSDIWGVRYNGQSFGTATKIELNDAGNALDPWVALDGNGDGWAVWSQSDGTHMRIWADRLLGDVGWLGAAPVQTSPDEDALLPQLAIDSNGNAGLVWTQSPNSSNFTPWLMRFDASSARWGRATLLDDSGAGGAPDIALFDPGAQAMIVWMRANSVGRDSVQARSDPGTGSASSSVGIAQADSGAAAAVPRVALSPSGNGGAIWVQGSGSSTVQIWANHFDGASGQWQTAVQLSKSNSTSLVCPDIAVDPTGSGFGVWPEITGTARVVRAGRLAAGGFVSSVQLGKDTTADPPKPDNCVVQVAVDAQGNAVAIWSVLEGSQYYVFAAVFE